MIVTVASVKGDPATTVVEGACGADAALMVTEPTPSGLHDLRLAVEVARDELGPPVRVVINRDGVGDRGLEAYCADEGIPILMRIPLDRRIAEAYSEGIPLVEAYPTYRERFAVLWKRLEELVYERGGQANERYERHPRDGQSRGMHRLRRLL